MTDTLIQFGINNLFLSLLLAIVAWIVHRSGRFPIVAHLLCLVVLAKLITPPLLTLPILAVPGLAPDAIVEGQLTTPDIAPDGAAAPDIVLMQSAEAEALLDSPLAAGWKSAIVSVWIIGCVCMLVWSMRRVRRFNRLLRVAAHDADPALRALAHDIARELGVRRVPAIVTTSANISPMVWWVGGRTRVVLPESLLHQLAPSELRWIIAHEMAHVRRGDHFVRWLEWIACVAFWWNPIAWWARRNLRINEELCCDSLVVSSFEANPRIYAGSLLTAIECLTKPALRVPSVASEINGGGFLEHRLQMIVSRTSTHRFPRWSLAPILLTGLLLLPLGVAYASPPDYDAVGQRLRNAVMAGKLTPDDAQAMMDALKMAQFMGTQQRLNAGIESGSVTREQAQRELDRLRGRLFAAPSGEAPRPIATKEHLTHDRTSERLRGRSFAEYEAAVRKRLAAACRNGQMTEAQAKQEYGALIAKARRAIADTQHPDDSRRPPMASAESAVDTEELKHQLASAVESGKMTESQAQAKLDALTADQDSIHEHPDLVSLKQRLTTAVRGGAITRDDAIKEYAEVEREIRGRERATHDG